MRFDLAFGLVCGLLGVVTAGSVQAQSFPTKPITIIVPFTPGASTDVITRVVAKELGSVIGQSVVVENRAGAGTILGAVAAKHAPPDGYTLYMGTNSFYASALTMKDPGYDPFADFVPLAAIGFAPYVLMSTSSVPSKTLNELVAYGKANPGKMRYGSLGRGTSQKFLAEEVKEATGLNWTEVPYKGGTEGVTALITGETQGYFATVSLAAQNLGQPKVSLVAIAASQRSSFLPNVPTFAELGHPQIVDGTWYVIFASSKVPSDVVQKLKTALASITNSQDLLVQLKNNSIEPYKGTLAAFEADARKTNDKFAASLKKFGVEPE